MKSLQKKILLNICIAAFLTLGISFCKKDCFVGVIFYLSLLTASPIYRFPPIITYFYPFGEGAVTVVLWIFIIGITFLYMNLIAFLFIRSWQYKQYRYPLWALIIVLFVGLNIVASKQYPNLDLAMRRIVIGSEGITNINTASTSELTRLPEMTPVLAKDIVQERETNGYYGSFKDIEVRVDGVDKTTISKWKDVIVEIPFPSNRE